MGSRFDLIETVHDGKFVEFTYKVIDGKSGHVLTCLGFPLGYVHGHNEILASSILMENDWQCATRPTKR